MLYSKSFIFSSILLTFFAGCAQKVEKFPNISKANFQQSSWDEIEGFNKDNFDIALDVFKKDCQASKKYENLKDVCEKSYLQSNPKTFFMTNFTPYKLISDDNSDNGLITGYYEPLLHGNLKKTNRYKYPVYSVPKDLLTIDLGLAYPTLKNMRLRGRIVGNKVIPYDSREDIEKIDPKNSNNMKIICYVDNKIDLFFLHIQGSGKVKLPSGDILNIGYAQQNGRKYFAIGRKLIEEGYIKKEDISLQTIKSWLLKNPQRVDEILNLNPSYIFFNQSDKTATGSLGTQLTANRNLAVDRKYIPLGYPVFINTTNPINNEPINKLMVAADTGGAIKGKIRADFFFGNGELAQELAGKMKQPGKLYIFIPKLVNSHSISKISTNKFNN